jgi:hypothetical protein
MANFFQSVYRGTCSASCWACDGYGRKLRFGSSKRCPDFAGQRVQGGDGAKLDGVGPLRLQTQPENVDRLVLWQESPEHNERIGVYGRVDRPGRVPEGTLAGKLQEVRLHYRSAGSQRTKDKEAYLDHMRDVQRERPEWQSLLGRAARGFADVDDAAQRDALVYGRRDGSLDELVDEHDFLRQQPSQSSILPVHTVLTFRLMLGTPLPLSSSKSTLTRS